MILLGWFLLAGLGIPETASAFPAAADTDSSVQVPVQESHSWLSGLFDRYLRTKPHPEDDLRGQAKETVSRYLSFAGWTIEVVLVNQVDTFDEDRHAQTGFATRFVNSLTNPLQSNTREATIRRQLLFHRGQLLDPLALADSELLLRSLPFIDDVRIMVLPLTGAERKVAVVVETRDNWPLGVDAKVVNKDRYNASLYSVNVLGYGLAMSHELVRNAGRDHGWGYHSHLRQPNPTGHFVDLDLDFEDSWRRLSRKIVLQKNLVHPAVRMVGGGILENTDDRDNDQVARKFTAGDFWLGRALGLGSADPSTGYSRLLLVPTVGYNRISFSDRPEVSLDENRSYHDRTLLLAGLSLLRVKDFKTSYFYKMGETEDIRSGWDAQITTAYEDGEFQVRSGTWLQAAMVAVGGRGRVLALRLGGGGYWRRGDFEEGVLDASGFFATRLYDLGPYGQRWYLRAHYTCGFDRFPGEVISLGNRTGLRGVDDDVLTGRQRLVTSLESRLFTPWTVLGFRCLMLGYVDAGVIADQNESLAHKPVMISTGIGVRMDNPGLVLPPFQIRVGVRDRIRTSGMIVELVFGGGRNQEEFLFPSVKPEPPAFR